MAERLRTADVDDPRDLEALVVLRRTWTEEDEPPRPAPGPGFDTAFTAWVRSEPRVFYLAELDGRAVGMLNVLTYHRMPRPGAAASTWGYLANAFVRAEARNAGIGTRLLGHALADCRRRGHTRVVLSPSPRSVPFYLRAGFRRADELVVWTPDAAR